jgi:uncharacterized protein YceK
MKLNILILVFLVLVLTGCGPILSDTSTHSYQGPTTHVANSATASGFQTADQTQNDNRPICAGLFVIGSCNVSQTNVQTITTARTQQEAVSAVPEPAAPAAYDGPFWTALIVLGALCWLFLIFKALTHSLHAEDYGA